MRVLLATHRGDAVGDARLQLGGTRPTWALEAASSPAEANEALAAGRYDVVVWDCALSGADPAAAFARLRREAPAAALVALVETGQEVVGAQAIAQGADCFLPLGAGWALALAVMAEHIADRRRAASAPGPAATALEASRAQAIMAAIGEPLLFANAAGVVLCVSHSALALMGQEERQVLGRSFGELLVAPDIVPRIVAYLASGGQDDSFAQPSGGIMQVAPVSDGRLKVTSFLRHGDGHYLLCDLTLSGVISDQGGLDSFLVTLRPHEQAEQKEQALRQLAAGALLEAAPIPLALAARSGILTHVNDTIAALAGTEASELLGRSLVVMTSPPDLWAQAVAGLAQGEPSSRVEGVLHGLDGVRKEVALTVSPVPGDEEGALLVCIDDLSELRALTSANTEISQQLDRLTGAIATIALAHSPEEIGRSAIEGVGRLAQFDAALILFEMPGNGCSRHAYGVGLDQALQERIVAALRAECGGATAQGSCAAVVIPELQIYCAEAGLRETAAGLTEAGLRSGCSVPLAVDGERVGTLYFGSRQDSAYGRELLPALAVLATQVAGALTKVSLYQQIQRDSDFARKLVELSLRVNAGESVQGTMKRIAEAAASISGSDYAWVEKLDEGGTEFEATYACAPDDEAARAVYLQIHDIAWRAVRQSEVVDVALETGSASKLSERLPSRAVAVPMALSGKIMGVLTAGYSSDGCLSQAQVNALRLLADQSAVALTNVQLYEVARKRSSRMEALAAQAWEEEARARTLFEAAAVVAERSDLDGILAEIARSAATEIGFERVRIYLADHDNQVLRGASEGRKDGAVVSISDLEVSLRAGSGLLADTALSSMPYAILPSPPEEEGGSRFESLFVPMRAQNSLVGVIAADNPRRMEPISHQQTRLLRSLATMASMAVERARVEELRTRFLSSVSHELRAPLSSIQAYNELVLDEEVGSINEDQRRYLTRIDSACGRLKRMIDDLMNWSRLQAGEISVDKKPTDLRQLITNVVESFQPQAERKQVRMTLDLERDLPVVYTDPIRVEQILTNLVDNAIKFNHAQGTVRIGARVYQGRIAVAVSDTGPGIPREMHQAIFEEFNRGPESLAKTAEGVGLGLAIASRLARYLGASITVDSEPGTGSIFFLWLPIDSPSDDEAVTARREDDPAGPGATEGKEPQASPQGQAD